jgi:hypothetical protein
MRRNLEVLALPRRIILVELAHQLTGLRALHQADEHRVAGTSVVGGVIVKPDVIAGLGIEIEGTRVRVVLRAGHDGAPTSRLRKAMRAGCQYSVSTAGAFSTRV